MTPITDRMTLLRFQNSVRHSQQNTHCHSRMQSMDMFPFMHESHRGCRCDDNFMQTMAGVGLLFQGTNSFLQGLGNFLAKLGFSTKDTTPAPKTETPPPTTKTQTQPKTNTEPTLTQQQKTEKINTTNAKIKEAKQNGEINLPKGYSLGEVTVADDGTISVDIKYKDEQGNDKTIKISGKDADDIANQLTAKSQELQKAAAQAKLNSQKPPITAPAGYQIDTRGIDKEGKSNGVYVLINNNDKTEQEFKTIDELRTAIEELNKKQNPQQTQGPNNKKVAAKPKQQTPNDPIKEKITNAGLSDYIKVENGRITFRYKLGATKMVGYTEQMLDQIIKDTQKWLDERK